MFEGDVTLRGNGMEATVVWGYHTAAVCQDWIAHRTPQNTWTLEAQVKRADATQLRQRNLKFAVPRPGGYLCFPVLAVTLGATTLMASLGPPEN